MSLIAEYHAVLRRLVEVAEKAIPAPEGGLSNFQLNEAEEAISAAHKLLNCTCDEGGSAGCPVHDAAVSKGEAVEMWLLIMGNPVDGFSYTGPFYSHDDVMNAGEDATNGGDWWIKKLERPPMRPQTKSEIIREIADSLGMKCIDMPLADIDPTDVIGFPVHK